MTTVYYQLTFLNKQMTTITNRAYQDQAHYHHLHDLLLAYRLATDVTVYPTFWRLRTLLTSRVWHPALDTQVWENEAGQMVGFAMLWRRRPDSPYLALEQIVHPLHVNEFLVTAMLHWANQRAQTMVEAQKSTVTFTAYAFGTAIPVANLLGVHGFKPSVSDPDMYNVYFARSLQGALPAPTLPDGYSIRSMRPEDDIEAYHALYGFAPVTAEHRRELLRSDEYCHLVATDTAGLFVAYAECSIWRAEWVGSGRRIGWIDYIGTKSEHQQRGLGKAVLLAALHHLQTWGADTAMLITVNTNTPAVRLYQATGFVQTAVPEPASYEKQLTGIADKGVKREA